MSRENLSALERWMIDVLGMHPQGMTASDLAAMCLPKSPFRDVENMLGILDRLDRFGHVYIETEHEDRARRVYRLAPTQLSLGRPHNERRNRRVS